MQKEMIEKTIGTGIIEVDVVTLCSNTVWFYNPLTVEVKIFNVGHCGAKNRTDKSMHRAQKMSVIYTFMDRFTQS